ANHLGALREAAQEANAMQPLQLTLAEQWERVALLMEGWIVQAVHQMDCLAFAEASAQLRLIADSLAQQAHLFHQDLPKAFPLQLRFDLRAKALGTLVQSETLAGLRDAAHLQEVRQYSDAAIQEFLGTGDKLRQYQYRCHLETVAQDFAQARHWLAR